MARRNLASYSDWTNKTEALPTRFAVSGRRDAGTCEVGRTKVVRRAWSRGRGIARLTVMSAPSEALVELLADHIEFVPTIARWHFDEWYPINSEVTVEDIAVRLSTWANRETMPLTYAAVEHGVPLGTASLVVHDMAPPAAGCEDLTPWLSGVFVIPRDEAPG